MANLDYDEIFLILFITLIIFVWWKGVTCIWKENKNELKEEE